MTHPKLQDALQDLGVDKYINEARSYSLVRTLASRITENIEQENVERLPRLGFLYETQATALYAKYVLTQEPSDDLEAARQLFTRAYECWEALTTLPGESIISDPNIVSPLGLQYISSELTGEAMSAELCLAFHIAATGMMGGMVAETRLLLNRFTIKDPQGQTWRERVMEHVGRAFVLLVRKQNGWQDIDLALASINGLRTIQKEFEDKYIQSVGELPQQTTAAVELVGIYHLAQMITLAGVYLVNGGTAISQLNVQMERHQREATKAFAHCNAPLLAHWGNLLWEGCREICQNSIWTHITTLGEDIRNFAKILADRGRDKPVIELWPSQQKALHARLLDPYPRAVLVEMPTSAGKTLLAKFSIVQTRALNPNATIAYVVPTRALVNQVTLDLRSDFKGINLKVEQAVPSFELNPTESALLSSRPDILVTTPEKLDLLIKGNHPATDSLSLVIADEAHNVGDGGVRGARLELLLGTIKRERPNARFLLMSPFLPNGEELARWLGEDRNLSIRVDWRPSQRIVGTISVRGRLNNRATVFTTVPATANIDVPPGIEFPVGPPTRSITLKELTKATVRDFLKQGSILVLCRGRGTAKKRADQIAEDLENIEHSELLQAICNYLIAETGREPSLVRALRKGVAYHHAGLSHETRWLIERLISKGLVKVVCGTTTLAQGMNFPIRTVIVETLKKGTKDLTYQDFWNIAGRAGRALIDSIGVVAFPASSAAKRRKWEDFLQKEALEISSQLADLIDQADRIGAKFNLATTFNWPQMGELMRFLAHAVRTAGESEVASEIENILRASLVYYQIKRREPNVAEKLVKLCRSYIESIKECGAGVLTLSDQTGFATPSVLALLARSTRIPEIKDVSSWQPSALFSGDVEKLTECISIIGELPEMGLGEGAVGPFNPKRIALILRDWVSGEPLATLAERYDITQSEDPETKLATFSQYLFSTLIGKASWGIGALEGICFAGKEFDKEENAAYVPSMIFYGVKRKEAVWLRMVGVPRIVADPLAEQWTRTKGAPDSYDVIRQWVSNLSDSAWQRAIPATSTLTPTDMRLLWKELGA